MQNWHPLKYFFRLVLLNLVNFSQYEGRIYIKISANNVIDLLKGEETTYFESGQQVEDAEIELKVL